MRYEATPRPELENHHHIRDLILGQEIRAADRQTWKEREAQKAENDSDIAAAKQVVLTDFWCDKGKKDFKAVAQLQVENDWTSMGKIASYKTKCFKRHWCARLVTDKLRDPYWQRSKAVRADRAKHSKDLIQPFEEGFNLLYGKPTHI